VKKAYALVTTGAPNIPAFPAQSAKLETMLADLRMAKAELREEIRSSLSLAGQEHGRTIPSADLRSSASNQLTPFAF
jgi:hypothetical protein